MPYLILVAVAVNRLGQDWVKNTTVVALVLWAALAGWQGIIEEKVSFHSLVHQMIEAEPPQTTGIAVYPLSGATEIPIRYYLELAGDERFRIERRKEIASIEGKHFWIALQESPWREEPVRQMLARYLMDRDYHVGEIAGQESPWREEPVRQMLARYLMDRDYHVGEGFESGPALG